MIVLLFLPIVLASLDPTQQELKAIRGVPSTRYALYQPVDDKFKCLDGSRTILYSQLNDDYCDCPDGSDEPGTSACPNSHFFCLNLGHTGNFIPTSRVNDKLCDCCDGTDEYNSEVTCPNNCDELGRAARVEKERVSVIARKGFAKRQEYSKEGHALKETTLKDVEPWKAEKATLETELQSLETAKKLAEDVERKLQDDHKAAWAVIRDEKKKVRSEELFLLIDTNKDGKITLDEIKALTYVDGDRDGQITDDEAKVFLTLEDADPSHFHSTMYDSLKTAKKHFEQETKLSEELEAEKAKALEHAGTEPFDEEDEEDKHENLDKEHDGSEEDDEDKMPPYPEDVKVASDAAVEARRVYDELNSKVRDIADKIREAEEFSSADYGEDMAWAALKGKCFDRNVQQYTYTFCPFGDTTQKDTGGYGGTSLGSFKNWSGPDNKKYSRQHYGDGQQCWNGPKRSTDISIECGEESELVEVTEPAKCEYQFVFRTPLACGDPDKDVHEEL